LHFSTGLAATWLEFDHLIFGSTSLQNLLYVLAGVIGIWLLIAAAGTLPLLLLWMANYDYVKDPAQPISRAVQATGGDWLPTAGFEPEGVIQVAGIQMALFRHADSHTVGAIYFAEGKLLIDIVTRFTKNVELTTTNTIDGVTLPPAPGCVVQCLPSRSLDELWHVHLETVQLLCQQCNINQQPMSGPLNQWVRDSTRAQIRHFIARPWLILATPYRYFVTRNRYRNVTVANQIERGWLDPATLPLMAHGF
jgi:hypothetical protein